jgi:hypothetical protein
MKNGKQGEKHQPDIAQSLDDPSEGETCAHRQHAENDPNQHGNRRSLAQQLHQHCCPRGLDGPMRKPPAPVKGSALPFYSIRSMERTVRSNLVHRALPANMFNPSTAPAE